MSEGVNEWGSEWMNVMSIKWIEWVKEMVKEGERGVNQCELMNTWKTEWMRELGIEWRVKEGKESEWGRE